jgi:hypothetical protein
MQNQFELHKRPIAWIEDGKWRVANIELVEPNPDDYPKGSRGYRTAMMDYLEKRSMIICALTPGLDEARGMVVDDSNARELIANFIEQVCIDTIRPDGMGSARQRNKDQVRNEARAYVFTQEFADNCAFLGISANETRKVLIGKWHKDEPPIPRMTSYRHGNHEEKSA